MVSFFRHVSCFHRYLTECSESIPTPPAAKLEMAFVSVGYRRSPTPVAECDVS